MGIICLDPVVIAELCAKNQQIYHLAPALSWVYCVDHHVKLLGVWGVADCLQSPVHSCWSFLKSMPRFPDDFCPLSLTWDTCWNPRMWSFLLGGLYWRSALLFPSQARQVSQALPMVIGQEPGAIKEPYLCFYKAAGLFPLCGCLSWMPDSTSNADWPPGQGHAASCHLQLEANT